MLHFSSWFCFSPSLSLYTNQSFFYFSDVMAELTEIPLELQLKEANRRIKLHVSKGQKYQQFLSPMFLRRFPAIMENQISVDWNTITGVYDRTPTLPITLIDTEILDDWAAHPSVWEVQSNQQHIRCVLAMVRYTLPVQHKGQLAMVFGASSSLFLAFRHTLPCAMP